MTTEAQLAEPEPSSPSVEQLARVEQLRLLVDHTPLSAVAQIFVGTIMVASLYETVGRGVLYWATGLAVVAAVRTIYARRTRKVGFDEPDRALTVLSALAGCSGAAWGISGLLYLDPAVPKQFAVVCYCIGALLVGSSTSLSAYFPAFVVFNLGALGLAVSGWVLRGGNMIAAAAVTAFYIVSSAAFARRQEQFLVDAIKLRLANEALANRLAKEKDAANSAREEAEKADLAKSAFLAAASHDLRQPVHAQSLYLEVLTEQVKATEAKSTLKRLRSTFDSLREMLDVLLDISRIDAGKTKSRTIRFPLEDIFSQLDQEFRPVATKKGLTLKVEPAQVMLSTDPTLVIRVLRNLMENAVRYTNRGEVILHYDAEKRAIGVRDTGIGFRQEQAGEIFDEYVQLGNPERDREKGLGLGLSIVKRLSKIVGAEIEVSASKDAGAHFLILLPETAQPGPVIAEQVEESATEAAHQELAGTKVFIVEDNKEVRHALLSLLNGWNMDAVAHESAASALRDVDSERDIHILDYRLPGKLDGIELATQLKGSHPDAPSLVISGDTGAAELERAEKNGLVMLHKPIDPAHLKNTMGALLRPAEAD